MLIDDWRSAIARLGEVEARMVAILDGLGLTTLVTSVPGVSAVGAAVILAETGDLSRFATARSVVKHAGLNPAENTSANFRGQTRVSHRGRPALRAAAWRAAWGALPHNPVLGARFTHLTTRERDRLAPGQARVACAATLLRWLYAIVTSRESWNPDRAAGIRAGQEGRQQRPDHPPWRRTLSGRRRGTTEQTIPSRGGASPRPVSSQFVKHQGPPRRTLHKLDCALSGTRPPGWERARLIIYVETQDSRRSPQLPREGAQPAGRGNTPRPAAPACPHPGRSAQQLTRPAKIDQPGQPLTTASYAGVCAASGARACARPWGGSRGSRRPMRGRLGGLGRRRGPARAGRC